MNVKLETIEENKRKLTVTVEAEAFNKALDVAFEKVSKNVEVKGFRKGKVPRAIFEKRFGEAALYEEAINYLIPIEYPKAVDEAKVFPVAQPEIDVDFESLGKDKDFTFTAVVVVKPTVTLGEYKGLELTQLSTEVTDEDVTNEINKLTDRYAELVVKEDEAKDSDTVVIDYVGSVDGVEFEGGAANNYSLKLGSNSFIPGFEDQLVGIKAGEDRDVNVTFPTEYHAEDLAGKEAVFKVHCHEVKERVLPELDDEFVKDLEIEGVETVEALKEDARKRLQDQKEQQAKNTLIDTAVDLAANNSTVNIPVEMIQEEAHRMLHDAEHQMQQQGISLDMYMQMTGQSHDDLVDQFKGEAEKRIRYNLTLEAIVEAEGIEATEEDINKEMEEMAKRYNVTVDQVKAVYTDTADIAYSVKLQKAMDFLVENANKKAE